MSSIGSNIDLTSTARLEDTPFTKDGGSSEHQLYKMILKKNSFIKTCYDPPSPPPILTPASCFGFENMKLVWLEWGI